MSDARSFGEATPLPPPPSGWFDYGYAALMDGRLALVRNRTDVYAENQRWWEAINSGHTTFRKPEFWKSETRLSIFDGAAETDVVVVPGTYPKVERMADGRWLLVSSRAGDGERNGHIYSPDGLQDGAIFLGHGIKNLLCAPDGTIWVGYIDEGVFAERNKDGTVAVSAGGIVQFDSAGRVLWSFNEQLQDARIVIDSYAMTLTTNVLWSCYYMDFPIVRLEGGSATFWSNAVAGATAIAVKDEIVLLAGGYRDDAGRLALVRLEGQSSRHLGNLRFTPPARGKAGLVQGRGSILHLVVDGIWTRIGVYSACSAINDRPRR